MIEPWRDRLDWTGERSPDSAARMKAMEAEIRELRRALKKSDGKLTAAQERTAYWRSAASKYRKSLIRQWSHTMLTRSRG